MLIGGLILATTLSYNARADNILLSTYNSDMNWSGTNTTKNFDGFNICSRDPNAVYISGGYDRFCKIMLQNDDQPYYCRTTADIGHGSTWKPGTSDDALTDCSIFLCDSGYTTVWNEDMQSAYGCAIYHPNSNCWTDSDSYRNINPRDYPSVFTNTGRASRTVECLMPTGRERPYTNGDCPHTQYKSEFIECTCLENDYLYSGSGTPDANGQITISCRSCPSQATCNGSTFRCINKYYTSPQGNSCNICPTPPSGSGWGWTDVCSTSNRTSNSSCSGGATSVQGCFIQGYYYEYADNSGTFELINNCYYTP